MNISFIFERHLFWLIQSLNKSTKGIVTFYIPPNQKADPDLIPCHPPQLPISQVTDSPPYPNPRQKVMVPSLYMWCWFPMWALSSPTITYFSLTPGPFTPLADLIKGEIKWTICGSEEPIKAYQLLPSNPKRGGGATTKTGPLRWDVCFMKQWMLNKHPHGCSIVCD